MIYLYIKTQNNTGLKYLGKTENDPFVYLGSGKYWLRHLKKHGYDITTEIIYESDNKEDIKGAGIYYSLFYNIVESDQWANLKLEEGDGGDTSKFINYNSLPYKNKKGKTYEELYGIEKAKILKQSRIDTNIKRGKRTNQTKNKISATRKRLFAEGKLKSEPSQQILTCPYCKFTTTYGNAHRWHFDKCKFKF
jgi:hypothetical protein